MSKTKTTSTEVAVVTGTTNAPAIVSDKPLSATQLKNIEKVITSDFTDLKAKLFGEIEMLVRARKTEIDVKYPADISEAREKVEAFVRQLQDEVARFNAEIKAEGYDGGGFDVVSVGSNMRYLNPTGRTVAINRLNESANVMRQRVETLIAQEQRRVQRALLLHGIQPSGAQDLLSSVPTLDQVLSIMQQDEVTAEEATNLMTPIA